MPSTINDVDEAITVAKLNLQDATDCYIMIGWQNDSFEMYIFVKDQAWKGRFSYNRLLGFSKNLHKTEDEYMRGVRNCLSQSKRDYIYELKSGFFYWKRILKEGPIVLEGFLPVELETNPKRAQPDLIEILVALNMQLRENISDVRGKFRTLLSEYQKCLKDTEEFLTLKIEMEKNLSAKFMNLLNVQKFKASSYNNKPVRFDSFRKLLGGHM